MCRKYVSWQTSVIGSFAWSELLNKGDPRSGRCRPTSNHTAYLYLCFSFRDQRETLSSGVYWRQNTAKSSCGWPVCKYGCCQPNCSPCWQWFLGLNLCLAQRTQASLGGGLQPNRGLFRQNRQCLSTADTELAEVEKNGWRQMDALKIKRKKNAFISEPQSCFRLPWVSDSWGHEASIYEI